MTAHDPKDRPLAVVEIELTLRVHDGDHDENTTVTVETNVVIGPDDNLHAIIPEQVGRLTERAYTAALPAINDRRFGS